MFVTTELVRCPRGHYHDKGQVAVYRTRARVRCPRGHYHDKGAECFKCFLEWSKHRYEKPTQEESQRRSEALKRAFETFTARASNTTEFLP